MILLLVIFIILSYIFSPRGRIDVDSFDVYSHKIPQSFNGFRLTQVSDVHNKHWKDDQRLTNLINDQKPDIIVVTGDFIDSRKTDVPHAVELMSSLTKIAPVYFISGNHEARLHLEGKVDYSELLKKLEKLGVQTMDQSITKLEQGNDYIYLMGVQDPYFEYEKVGRIPDRAKLILEAYLQDKRYQVDGFRILLSHRPNEMAVYAAKGFDLVLSGHAHGGQFIIPFVGALIGPGGQLLPKYTNGLYKEEQTQLVVSRGLADSIIPLRLNNNYHLVNIDLYHQD